MLGLSLSGPDISLGSPQGGYDVFLIAGQSNNHSGTTINPAIDVSDPNVFQWGRTAPNDGVIILAEEPLDHHDVQGTAIGYALAMMRDYYVPNGHLAAGRNVLLIPGAEGGTGFNDNRWNDGDDLFEDAVARVNAAISGNPGSVFKGILWHQGEDDLADADYAAKLDAALLALRTDIDAAGASTPIVLGGMTGDTATASENSRWHQSMIHGTPYRLANCAYADSERPTELGPSNLHFTAAEQRIFAERYYDAWLVAQSAGIDQPSYSFDDDLLFFVRFRRGIFEDVSTNGAVITRVNSPIISYDIERGLTFDLVAANNAYLTTDQSIQSADYTKAAWFNFENTSGNDNIISSGGPAAGDNTGRHAFWVVNSKLQGGHNGTWGSVESATLDTDTWYHGAVTYDAGTGDMVLYLDGSEVDTAASVVLQSDPQPCNIGSYKANILPMRGKIDDARLYDRVLTPSEIAEIYAGDVAQP